MATWNSRGLRGSMLEDMIRVTNELFREKKLALIQKIPTPITPIKIDQATRHITLAYFDEKSTVDYIGAVQGVPLCFDAKECAGTRFALQNLHAHQLQYMAEFEEQGGIAFFLIYFKQFDTYYYLSLKEAQEYVEKSRQGGWKHIKYEELRPEFFIPLEKRIYINYLKIVQKDLDQRK